MLVSLDPTRGRAREEKEMKLAEFGCEGDFGSWDGVLRCFRGWGAMRRGFRLEGRDDYEEATVGSVESW